MYFLFFAILSLSIRMHEHTLVSFTNILSFLEQGNNDKIIKDIEQSMFILCLDKEMPKEAFVNKNNASVRALQSLTGYSSDLNAGNRWHDKTLQVTLNTDKILISIIIII